jgi:hypothetical protein
MHWRRLANKLHSKFLERQNKYSPYVKPAVALKVETYEKSDGDHKVRFGYYNTKGQYVPEKRVFPKKRPIKSFDGRKDGDIRDYFGAGDICLEMKVDNSKPNSNRVQGNHATNNEKAILHSVESQGLNNVPSVKDMPNMPIADPVWTEMQRAFSRL